MSMHFFNFYVADEIVLSIISKKWQNIFLGVSGSTLILALFTLMMHQVCVREQLGGIPFILLAMQQSTTTIFETSCLQ